MSRWSGAPILGEIRPRLFANVEKIEVNGQDLNSSGALLDAMRDMHGVTGHHSSPTIEYRVSLQTSNGPLSLCLRRDSQHRHEYWVYYPGFYSTSANEVGRVLPTR